MAIPRYNLHDVTAEQLAAELVARIPGHTPEWRNPRPGDPGRTLIDLFAWLGDKLLYRVNLLPERQRLMFLSLLNMPLRPARPARGLVQLQVSNPAATAAVSAPSGIAVQGPAEFETVTPATVLPVTGQVYMRRKPNDFESSTLDGVITDLEQIYGIDNAVPYISTPLFADNRHVPAGVDFVRESVDQSLWVALLAPSVDLVEQVRANLPGSSTAPNLLNIGFEPLQTADETEPGLETPATGFENWAWEISTNRMDGAGQPVYLRLDHPAVDTTSGLAQRGVMRLALPDADTIGLPENDTGEDFNAGVGSRPPRIDDDELAALLVAWLRLRPRRQVETLPVSWLGINAVEIAQHKTAGGLVVGRSNGAPDQVFSLPGTSVDPDSLVIQVATAEQGYVQWRRTNDLYVHDRDDQVFQLDAEAGTVKFGDGMRGLIPPSGAQVRVARMRSGGGRVGNLDNGVLSSIAHPRLAAVQPVPTNGGEDAETLDAAEKRIPAMLRHRERAVTAEDYRDLAFETPGITLGRVEVLPRFRPFQRRSDVAGVVSVAIIPQAASLKPPHPRADRITIAAVQAHLDARRPVASELYVIGVDYVPVSVSVSVGLRAGYTADQVFPAIETALRRFLFPTSPGGRLGEGWPLGQAVSNLELEVIVARVTGVRIVHDVNLFAQLQTGWDLIEQAPGATAQSLSLESWQLPELSEISIVADQPEAPSELGGDTGSDSRVIAVPVVPEVC